MRKNNLTKSFLTYSKYLKYIININKIKDVCLTKKDYILTRKFSNYKKIDMLSINLINNNYIDINKIQLTKYYSFLHLSKRIADI